MYCRQQESEIASLTRRIRLVDEDFEQTETRLHTTSEKLDEASKLAEETERYGYTHLCFLTYSLKRNLLQSLLQYSVNKFYYKVTF